MFLYRPRRWSSIDHLEVSLKIYTRQICLRLRLPIAFTNQSDVDVSVTRPYKMVYVGEMHDKIFVCMDCGKSYAVKRSLWRHRKFECVNSKPKFSCEVCSYKSPHKWCIDKHRKRHHDHNFCNRF